MVLPLNVTLLKPPAPGEQNVLPRRSVRGAESVAEGAVSPDSQGASVSSAGAAGHGPHPGTESASGHGACTVHGNPKADLGVKLKTHKVWEII